MLLEIYIFFQFIVLGLFLLSFFTKQEILWVITLILSATLAITGFTIEQHVPVFNATINAYTFQSVTYSYPYLSGINMIFFGLSLLIGFFDIFEKYGINLFRKKNNEN